MYSFFVVAQNTPSHQLQKPKHNKHTQSIHLSTSDIMGVCDLSGHLEHDPSIILLGNKREIEEPTDV